jgi:hypothetical protein
MVFQIAVPVPLLVSGLNKKSIYKKGKNVKNKWKISRIYLLIHSIAGNVVGV